VEAIRLLPSTIRRTGALPGLIVEGAVAADVMGSGRQTIAMRPRRFRPSPLTRSPFAGFCSPPEVIVLAVRWYLASRSPTATLKNCSPNARSRSTTPPSAAGSSGSRRCWPRPLGPADTPWGTRWQVDEAYTKVAGQRRYIYRAIDQFGQVIDVFVSPRRDATAARRFFQQAIGATRMAPVEVVTDKAAAYPILVDEVLPAVWHRTEQYANNHIECDYGRLKAWLRPMRRLKQDHSARVVVAGHALVQYIRRGHHDLAVEALGNRRVAVAFDDHALRLN